VHFSFPGTVGNLHLLLCSTAACRLREHHCSSIETAPATAAALQHWMLGVGGKAMGKYAHVCAQALAKPMQLIWSGSL